MVKGGNHIRQSIKLCYSIANGDYLNRKASCKAMRYRPLNIRHGNGASVVVRAR